MPKRPELNREPLTMTSKQIHVIESLLKKYRQVMSACNLPLISAHGLTTDWEDMSEWEAQQLIYGLSRNNKEYEKRALTSHVVTIASNQTR